MTHHIRHTLLFIVLQKLDYSKVRGVIATLLLRHMSNILYSVGSIDNNYGSCDYLGYIHPIERIEK